MALRRENAKKPTGPSRAVQMGLKKLATASTKRGMPPGAKRISPVFTGKNPAPGRKNFGSSPQPSTPPQQRTAPLMKRGMPPQGAVRKNQLQPMPQPRVVPEMRRPMPPQGTMPEMKRPMPPQRRPAGLAKGPMPVGLTALGQRPSPRPAGPGPVRAAIGAAAMQQAKPAGGGQALNMSATAKPAGGGMKKGGAPLRKFQGGGAVYEVNGQRVTKEQYEKAGKEIDSRWNSAGSKNEEDMMDFARKAAARNKPKPINKAKGGEAKKPPGLYANIHAKRKRIAAGSKEKMRKVGSKGAPTKAAFIKSAKTARKG